MKKTGRSPFRGRDACWALEDSLGGVGGDVNVVRKEPGGVRSFAWDGPRNLTLGIPNHLGSHYGRTTRHVASRGKTIMFEIVVRP